jgi:hypothetical protein
VTGLPEGEDVAVEAVSDEPWWAFNYYLGGLRSRIVVNTDVPTTGLDLLRLVAHEGYPGHHAEHATKEAGLVNARGLVEEAIAPVPTPQSLVSEGIAEAVVEVLLDDATREQAYEIIRRHGLELVDPDRSERISRVMEVVGRVGLNVALMVHEDGMDDDAAVAYAMKWTLRPQEEVRRSLSFVTSRTWRSYAITYDAGRDLCRRYLAGDPGKARRLLGEQVRIAELLSG